MRLVVSVIEAFCFTSIASVSSTLLHFGSVCTVDLWFPFRPNLIFRQSEIVACWQMTRVDNGFLS